jgi:pimeloyl-ACP methyl ester carboxylesterase
MKIDPFRIHIPDDVLNDLRDRLRRTRWPDQIAGSGWSYGTDGAYLRELVAYWIERFDWRAQEAALNRFAHFRADVDGFGLHFIHQRGRGPDPVPLLISHGWPGSFVEFTEIIGPLTDPAAHGGDAADAFDLVIPSLPGYGFSDRPREPGMDVMRVAALFARLMEGLGYQHWGAQGGDWGSAISTALGTAFSDRVRGVHLNMLIAARPPSDPSALPEAERQMLERFNRFRAEETGYMQIQGTKPQTLGYGLNDSPAGLAAWIVEKFRTWSDCGGDVERRFTKDRLLTNITLYWVTESINSSIRLYYETIHNPALRGGLGAGGGDPVFKVTVPTGAAIFPAELYAPPRSWAEKTYNITRWTEMPAGGHFAAMEEPAALVEDIRAFFRPLR